MNIFKLFKFASIAFKLFLRIGENVDNMFVITSHNHKTIGHIQCIICHRQSQLTHAWHQQLNLT